MGESSFERRDSSFADFAELLFVRAAIAIRTAVKEIIPFDTLVARLFRKIPPSARERAIFSPAKDGEAGDIGFIVDGAGCSQAGKGPLEARASFPTEPNIDCFGISIIDLSFEQAMYNPILACWSNHNKSHKMR